MDPFALQLFGGPDALPGAGDLDQHALAADPGLPVQVDKAAGLGQGAFGVETEPGVDLGGDAAGHDFEDMATEGYEELVHERLGASCLVARRVEGESSASSTRSWYSGFWAACKSKEGLVVASCGLCSAMASMSPVSATTVV